MIEALDLAKEIQSQKYIRLPGRPLQSNIDKVCTIFQNSAEDVVINKFKPSRNEPVQDIITRHPQPNEEYSLIDNITQSRVPITQEN